MVSFEFPLTPSRMKNKGVQKRSGARDVPMYTIFRGIFPFWVAIVVCIMLLVLFPQGALFLPGTMTQ